MNRRVLVVEDDPVQRTQFNAMLGTLASLRSIPIQTELASSLREAAAALRGSPPFDLVLADFDLGGGETSLGLRDQCGPRTRFVLTSGRSWREIFHEEAPPAAAHRYLTKLTTRSRYIRGLEECLFAPTASDLETQSEERALAAVIATLLSPLFMALLLSLPGPYTQVRPGELPKPELNDFPLMRALRSPTLQTELRQLLQGGLTPVLDLKCCRTTAIPSIFGRIPAASWIPSRET
jgi:CheY-like chemotaxis protein